MDAIKNFFQKYARCYFETFQSHTWRTKRFWSQDVELILLKHQIEIKELFEAFGDKLTANSDISLSMNSFLIFNKEIHIEEAENMTAKEIKHIYNLSIQT